MTAVAALPNRRGVTRAGTRSDGSYVISAKITVSEGEVPLMPARRKTTTRKSTTAKKKWVYLFAAGKAEGNADMRALLGGKGAGLAEMTNAGLPVPPGFTITTEACNAYFASNKRLPPGLWDQAEQGLAAIEKAAGKTLGDPKNPLLLAGGPGAAMSMPRVMGTLANPRANH